jgi:hypothetical protein
MSTNSSMRIALCLSGQARSYKKAHEFIDRNLLSKYNVDVFAHTWRPQYSKVALYDGITNLYNPVNFVLDDNLPENINSDLYVPNASHPANFCTSMFYSIYRANDFRLKFQSLNNIKYDFVVRSRFDLALNKVIDFSSLQKGKVYVSKDTEDENALLNDQFAIADPDTMNIYAATFLHLRWHAYNGVPLCGHAMLEAQLQHFGVQVERIDIDHPFVDGRFNRGRHSLIRDDMDQWVDTKIWGYK